MNSNTPSIPASSARMWRGILILVIGSVTLTCLLTPPVYSLLLYFFPELPWPFSRVLDRVFMVCVLGFVIALRDRFELGALKGYLGGEPYGSRSKLVAIGFVISLCASMASMLFLLYEGRIAWEERTAGQLAFRFAKVLPAALLISLIEESFFRVLFFFSLRRMFSTWTAGAICSAVYAFVHFIIPDKRWEYPGLSLTIGFEYLGSVMGDIFGLAMLPALFGLFIVGLGLCHLIERTRSLFLCIGLHAGWVMAIKLVSYVAPVVDKELIREEALRRYFLVTEPFSWLTILAAFVMAHLAANRLRGKEPK